MMAWTCGTCGIWDRFIFV